MLLTEPSHIIKFALPGCRLLAVIAPRSPNQGPPTSQLCELGGMR